MDAQDAYAELNVGEERPNSRRNNFASFFGFLSFCGFPSFFGSDGRSGEMPSNDAATV